MTQTNEVRQPAGEQVDVEKNYQPLALKAVLAAAMMLKRASAGDKAKKAA